MRRVLITGAAGFLASHLTDVMLARGYEVVGVDDLSHGNLRNLDEASRSGQFQFYQLDVSDLSALRNCAGRIDAVVHLAAYKIPRYSTATNTLLVNSQGTLSVLRLACEQSARFIITSTSDVYGKNPNLPFAEDADSVLGPPTVSRWAYAASKLFDEHLVLAMAEDAGIYATILRIFGSYGPRQNLSWWGGPQSVFIDAVLRGETIPIHGDGLQTRSFTFVRDTVRGIAAAVESSVANGEIVNIGSSEEVSILELARRIHKICGGTGVVPIRTIPYNDIAQRKYEDVRRRIPDTRKAKELLGFEATVSLDEGLQETIAWQQLWTEARLIQG
jgi:UDP-glucose 4-epimerase